MVGVEDVETTRQTSVLGHSISMWVRVTREHANFAAKTTPWEISHQHLVVLALLGLYLALYKSYHRITHLAAMSELFRVHCWELHVL